MNVLYYDVIEIMCDSLADERWRRWSKLTHIHTQSKHTHTRTSTCVGTRTLKCFGAGQSGRPNNVAPPSNLDTKKKRRQCACIRGRNSTSEQAEKIRSLLMQFGHSAATRNPTNDPTARVFGYTERLEMH